MPTPKTPNDTHLLRTLEAKYAPDRPVRSTPIKPTHRQGIMQRFLNRNPLLQGAAHEYHNATYPGPGKGARIASGDFNLNRIQEEIAKLFRREYLRFYNRVRSHPDYAAA